MNPINLYDIYRKVSKRARVPKSPETQIKAEAMRVAAETILNHPRLFRVNEFRKAEQLWLQSPDISAGAKTIADQFEDAIRSKYYFVERSHFDPRGTNGNRLSGLVYCAMSASMPGQLKIGFTTLNLRTRLQKIAPKHGIERVHPLFSINTSFPAEIEAGSKRMLREHLVAGCTRGGSNEWYQASAIEFARAVVATVEKNGNAVSEVKLYSGCPNANNVKVAFNRLGVEVSRESWQ
jgi:hypothetical protein